MVMRILTKDPVQMMQSDLRLAKTELVQAEAALEANQFRVLYLKAKIKRLEEAVDAAAPKK